MSDSSIFKLKINNDEKVSSRIFIGTLTTFTASALNVESSKSEKEDKKSHSFLLYPSGSGSFIDGCGNTVGFSWSCNYNCSSHDIASAITQFIAGYGCGNYGRESYT